jgi:hypothetical protein
MANKLMTAALRLEMPDLAVDIFEDSFGFCFDTDPAKGKSVKKYLITVLVCYYLFFIPSHFNLISLSLISSPLFHILSFSFICLLLSHRLLFKSPLSSHFYILIPTTPPLPYIPSY